MYTVTIVHSRPVSLIPFFNKTGSTKKQVGNALAAAPGFQSKTSTLSDDGLTLTVVYNWDSAEAAKAFNDSMPTVAPGLKKSQKKYNASHGILKSVV